MFNKFKFAFFIIFCLQAEVLGRTNIALHKTTYGSTPYNSQTGSKNAVDGIVGINKLNCFHGHKWGFWFAVDLEESVFVQTVVLYSRTDCCKRMNNFNVRISQEFSSSDISKYRMCGRYDNTDIGEKVSINCEPPLVQSRYVTVDSPVYEFTICEVEVYQRSFDYLGCYEEVRQSDVNSNFSLTSCLDKCFTNLTSFAAIKNENQCTCSDLVTKYLPDTSCDTKCTERPSYSCGGRMSTYSVYAVCRPGYYGTKCEKVCHCKNETPCKRNGTCWSRCEDGWEGKNCDIMKKNRTFSYLGCYDSNIGLKKYSRDLYECFQFCYSKNFIYLGVKKWECQCLSEFSMLRKSDRCIVENGLYVDEESTVALYEVCTPHSFGDFCLDTCHCSSQNCSKVDGKCWEETCEPGWKGRSCNIRDCSVSNGACVHSKCSDEYDEPLCVCHEGFSKFNFNKVCEDIDECELQMDECDANVSQCHNNPGSYECNCLFRYIHSEGSNRVCHDIDECLTDVCDKETASCTNSPGTFSCSCNDGFYSLEPNTTCYDLDECSRSNGGCDEISTNCTNTYGSYKCLCKDENALFNASSLSCQFISNPTITKFLITILVSIFISLILLLILVGLFMMHRVRRRNLKHSKINEELQIPEMTRIPLEDLEQNLKNNQTEIKKQFLDAPKQTDSKCDDGANIITKTRNRFKNILPYDINRVRLRRECEESGQLSDYINASFIIEKHPVERVKFIATQGPNDYSVNDFWLMVWQQDVDAIVMLTLTYEEGRNKCSQYWSESNDGEIFGGLKVSVESTQFWPHFIIRKINLSELKTGKKKDVTHLQYTSWADKGVPKHTESLLHLRRKMIFCSKEKVVVHCSAGIGRTGTFLALDYLLRESSSQNSVDFLHCLTFLRSQRPQMIQNLKQYLLCFKGVLLDYKIGNTSIQTDSYESFTAEFNKLNLEDKDGKTAIDKEFDVLLEETEGLTPATEQEYMVVLPNNLWQAYFFPSIRKPSSFVAGTLCPNTYLSNDIVNILSQPEAIALYFPNQQENIMETILPSEGKEIILYEDVVRIKCTTKSGEMVKVTYEILPQSELYINTQTTNSTSQKSKEFSLIPVPCHAHVKGDLIADVWRFARETTGTQPTFIYLIGNTIHEMGEYMAAANIFEMIECYGEANIFQIALDLMLVEPSSINLVTYHNLYAITKDFLAWKLDNSEQCVAHILEKQ